LICETIGTAAIPGLLCQPRVIVKMIVEKQMECRLAGETEILGENPPQRHFCPSQNPTWPNSGLNPGRRGGKPAFWRIVSVTSSKLKPLIFYVSGFAFSDVVNICIFMNFVWPLIVVCTIPICNNKCTVLGNPCASCVPPCTLKIYQWCGEPRFANAAILKASICREFSVGASIRHYWPS
jgi:hypothetical protein